MSTRSGLQGSVDKPLLEPLHLPSGSDNQPVSEASPDLPEVHLGCPLCEQLYSSTRGHDALLKHLLLTHKLVIADVKLIADFVRYLEYWRQRFKLSPLAEFCTAIQTNSKDADPAPKELFYLLSDVLPEDKELRVKLQQEKLVAVLAQQQIEREDRAFSRSCLFCREDFEGNRAELINHMAFEHNFNVGQPDNLVYTGEFLDVLQKKLDNLECLYCEKTFKDRHVLKEHMRKKQHKKLNPRNTVYDKFYVINYLELGKNWEVLQSEGEGEEPGLDLTEPDTSSDEWSDWREEGSPAICLFCDHAATITDKLMEHMKEIHYFDLENLRQEMALNFYQQVKLINYIRRQVHQGVCCLCQEEFGERDQLLSHMNFTGHISRLPDASVWDQPQYYFPTYENDKLLCVLEESSESGDGNKASPARTAEQMVVPEELPLVDSILGRTLHSQPEQTLDTRQPPRPDTRQPPRPDTAQPPRPDAAQPPRPDTTHPPRPDTAQPPPRPGTTQPPPRPDKNTATQTRHNTATQARHNTATQARHNIATQATHIITTQARYIIATQARHSTATQAKQNTAIQARHNTATPARHNTATQPDTSQPHRPDTAQPPPRPDTTQPPRPDTTQPPRPDTTQPPRPDTTQPPRPDTT